MEQEIVGNGRHHLTNSVVLCVGRKGSVVRPRHAHRKASPVKLVVTAKKVPKKYKKPNLKKKMVPKVKVPKEKTLAVGHVVPERSYLKFPREGVLPSEPVIVRGAYDGGTSFQLYLREIAETPLLTPQDEIDLAARIKRGDKEAREHMIKANLRLVVKIARDYENYGVPLLDLVSEGNIGLMKAVERFDPSKGAKLSTYAAWWIKQAIKRALANQSKTIRLPVHIVDKLFHVRKTTAKLQELLGREPADAEVADELGTTAEKIAQLRLAHGVASPAPLNGSLGNDEDSNRLIDVVADETAEDPSDELEKKINCAMVQKIVLTLVPREATIIRYRYGLDGGDEKTLEEVGLKFGITRERVRQIQEITLRKLANEVRKLERMPLVRPVGSRQIPKGDRKKA